MAAMWMSILLGDIIALLVLSPVIIIVDSTNLFFFLVAGAISLLVGNVSVYVTMNEKMQMKIVLDIFLMLVLLSWSVLIEKNPGIMAAASIQMTLMVQYVKTAWISTVLKWLRCFFFRERL